MKPSEELKLNFLWKSDVFGNVTNRLSPEDLEKNKFANFKSSIDDKFLIKRVDDGVILKNTADSVRYAVIGEKVARNNFFMVLYDYEKRLEKREDEKRGVLLLMALLFGIPSGFMLARIGKTIAKEGFPKRDKKKLF